MRGQRLVVALAAVAVWWAAAPVAAQQPVKSLYQRLGGYDAIAAVTDDFMGRLGADTVLNRYFRGISATSGQKLRQLIVDQLCAAAGGPCLYTGRDMKTSHTGLGITASEWQRFVDHLTATLVKFKVPAAEQREVLDIIGGTKGAIVEKM